MWHEQQLTALKSFADHVWGDSVQPEASASALPAAKGHNFVYSAVMGSAVVEPQAAIAQMESEAIRILNTVG